MFFEITGPVAGGVTVLRPRPKVGMDERGFPVEVIGRRR